MGGRRIFGEARVPTERADGLDDLARARHRHGGIVGGVERPQGHVHQRLHLRWIVAAADGHGRAPPVRVARRRVVGAVSPHRHAGHIQLLRVDGGELLLQLGDQRQRRRQGPRRLRRSLALAGRRAPRHAHPLLIQRALRRHHEQRPALLVLRLHEHQRRGLIRQLVQVVVAAPARAVKEQDQRHLPSRRQVSRDIDPVRQDVAGPIGEGPRFQVRGRGRDRGTRARLGSSDCSHDGQR